MQNATQIANLINLHEVCIWWCIHQLCWCIFTDFTGIKCKIIYYMFSFNLQNIRFPLWIWMDFNVIMTVWFYFVCALYNAEVCRSMISVELVTETESGGKWKKMTVCLFTEKEHWIKLHSIFITLLVRASATIPIAAAAAVTIRSLFGIREAIPLPAALFLWKIS